MGWRDQKLKSSGNILTTKCMNVHMYVLCKANATMYMYVYVLHTCMYCVHVCTLVVHIYSHTCTQVVRTVVHIIVKWHFHFTNTDGVSMMSNYIFNTYSSKRNLFYFFYLATCYIPTSLSMRVALETRGFFKIFGVAFGPSSSKKNSWIVQVRTLTKWTQLNLLLRWNLSTTWQTFVMMRVQCPFD